MEIGKDKMKFFSIIASLLLTAIVSFAQAPNSGLSMPSADVYVGYFATSPDYGSGAYVYQFNGAEVGYTKYLRPRLGIVGSVSFQEGSPYSVKHFEGTVGPKFNLMTGKFRPYGTFQIGYAHQSSDGMYAADHHPPIAKGLTVDESGFTYRMGVGLDLQFNKHWYWRALHWDTKAMPWGRNSPWYTDFGTGVGYRF
jgi:hypothetical protein